MTSKEAIELGKKLRAEGKTWAQVAQAMAASGYRGALSGQPLTGAGCYSLVHHAKIKRRARAATARSPKGAQGATLAQVTKRKPRDHAEMRALIQAITRLSADAETRLALVQLVIEI